MGLLGNIRALVRRAGLDVAPFDLTHPLARRMRLIEAAGIDLVADVGANEGQYALQLRALGYRGKIVSFEPSSAAFAALRRNADWQCEHVALGEAEGEAELHVAGNSQSSSLLPMLDLHVQAAPESRYVGTERVMVRTLDSFALQGNLLVKLDVQGFEERVLRGAQATLQRTKLLQLECSLVPLYEGERTLEEMLPILRGYGFAPVSLEPGFTDPRTARLLQVDLVCAR